MSKYSVFYLISLFAASENSLYVTIPNTINEIITKEVKINKSKFSISFLFFRVYVDQED